MDQRWWTKLVKNLYNAPVNPHSPKGYLFTIHLQFFFLILRVNFFGTIPSRYSSTTLGTIGIQVLKDVGHSSTEWGGRYNDYTPWDTYVYIEYHPWGSKNQFSKVCAQVLKPRVHIEYTPIFFIFFPGGTGIDFNAYSVKAFQLPPVKKWAKIRRKMIGITGGGLRFKV